MRVLITSRSGAGKSTVCQELARRGLNALDGDDVEGLARWVEAASGKPIRMDYSNPIIDRDMYHWDWDEAILRNLLSNPGDVFLCGSADNQLEFHMLFDVVFVLNPSPDTQRKRLTSRTSHNYAKHPAMQEIVVTEQREFVEQAANYGAIVIDADPSIAEVTDNILEQLSHDN